METNASHRAPPHPENDRRRFLCKCISDAQVEFSGLESPLKVMESGLLTAMGAIGAGCGFNAIRKAEANGVNVVGRGMDRASIALIEENFQDLVNEYFPTLETATHPFQTEIRIIPDAPRSQFSLAGAKVSLVAGWRMDKTLTGLMGIGANLKNASFSDREIDFIHHLVDHMRVAIRSIAAHSVIHTLKNELDQARQRAADNAGRNEAARKELGETLFRLSGFNDIFHELSGLKESEKVLDAFLLVMLGIFSAQRGTMLYWDDTTGKAYTTMRGFGDNTTENAPPDVVKKTIASVFGSRRGDRPGVMEAAIVPTEQLHALNPFSPESSIAVSFRVAPNAKGVLCLGSRLVEARYGTKERELLLAFTHTFLGFLKNSNSFETIQRLNAEQKQKNIALEKTVQALSESRRTVAGLENAGERIKAAIGKAMARTTRVSIMDVALILIAGTMLGLIYNVASPSGIPVLPRSWRYPPSPQVTIDDTRALLATRTILVVDARPTEFYKQRHIRGALNLPLPLFDFVYMMRFSQIDPQQPLVVYGRNISRHYDEEIAFKLKERGHPNVSILSGGLKAWQAGGLAVSP
jgi:rhodanese-related sulfurtransferase